MLIEGVVTVIAIGTIMLSGELLKALTTHARSCLPGSVDAVFWDFSRIYREILSWK